MTFGKLKKTRVMVNDGKEWTVREFKGEEKTNTIGKNRSQKG